MLWGSFAVKSERGSRGEGGIRFLDKTWALRARARPHELKYCGKFTRPDYKTHQTRKLRCVPSWFLHPLRSFLKGTEGI